MMCWRVATLLVVIATLTPASEAAAQGGASYNLTIATDASPDLTSLKSLVDSATSGWTSEQEKVWALFYWTHKLRRQTTPMVLHGFEVTDPIRNFTDYGFTMCSTISGINQSLYEQLGLRHQYWDVCNHTVAAVEYDGSFHMVDSSMSQLVTLDDGVTLASVQEASANRARLVQERNLSATSANGFLTGSDTIRNLSDAVNPANGTTHNGFARVFCENSLKLRDYYYNWDFGHRYVLNLRDGESYTRYYRRLASTPEYWVPSERVSNPDPAQTIHLDSANRFGVRANGSWTYSPRLTAAAIKEAYRRSNVHPVSQGLIAKVAGVPAEVVYKVEAANAMTSQRILVRFARTDHLASAAVSVSVNHGVTWTQLAGLGTERGPDVRLEMNLRSEVSGSYGTLVRIQMNADRRSPAGIILTGVTIDTTTQVNTKALPRLNLGRNEVYVGAGDQTETMVLWPDLRGDRWRQDIHDSHNIASQSVSVPRKFTAVVYPAVLTEAAHLTYRLEAPGDMSRLSYGGRLHNYRAGSYIDFLHSFDQGVTWTRSYRFDSTEKPWDAIHYETIGVIPPGVRSVLVKFVIHNTEPGVFRASGLYSLRIEAGYKPSTTTRAPIDVTFRWNEVQADRSTVARSHRQRVDAFPFRYVVNVGGSDHPVMESIRVNVQDGSDTTPFGYGDAVDAGGERYAGRKRTDGTNLASGMPYSFSRAPSGFQISADATNTSILTDGIVGAPASGGISYWWGQCWSAGPTVDLQIDLGSARSVGAMRAHLFGYPFWDALKGQVQDRIQVSTSLDGITFEDRGQLETSLWRKDVPIDYMLQDDEKATAWNFELKLPAPVEARYVRYHVTPKRNFCASELQVLDAVVYEPFDLRITLP